jgi:peptidoglycan/LPS O-acetylase OafA/YrhL
MYLMMSARVYSVDSLRAIAMTMVIAQHCGLLPFGWTGVWLFYVISGFVISRNLIEEKASAALEPGGHYLSFLVRRAFRIIPPYAAYILLCMIVALMIDLPAQAREIPYLATFTYNWRMIFSLEPQSPILGHLWTISVEEQFYIFFPWIILLLRRDRAILALFVIVAFGPIFRVLLAQYLSAVFPLDPGRNAFGVYASSLGQFDAFALGSLLAHFESHIRKSPQIAVRMLWGAVAVGTFYAIAYACLNILAGEHGINVIRNIYSGIVFGQNREVFVYIAVDLTAAAIVAGAIARLRIFNFLEHPKLVSVGQASYSGYLVHPIVLILIHQIAGSVSATEPVVFKVITFFVALACTVAVARTSYIMFERQFVRYGHLVSKRILDKARAGERGLAASTAECDGVVAPERSTKSV